MVTHPNAGPSPIAKTFCEFRWRHGESQWRILWTCREAIPDGPSAYGSPRPIIYARAAAYERDGDQGGLKVDGVGPISARVRWIPSSQVDRSRGGSAIDAFQEDVAQSRILTLRLLCGTGVAYPTNGAGLACPSPTWKAGSPTGLLATHMVPRHGRRNPRGHRNAVFVDGT